MSKKKKKKRQDYRFDSVSSLWSIIKLFSILSLVIVVAASFQMKMESLFGQPNFISKYLPWPISILLVGYSVYGMYRWFSNEAEHELTRNEIVLTIISVILCIVFCIGM